MLPVESSATQVKLHHQGAQQLIGVPKTTLAPNKPAETSAAATHRHTSDPAVKPVMLALMPLTKTPTVEALQTALLNADTAQTTTRWQKAK